MGEEPKGREQATRPRGRENDLFGTKFEAKLPILRLEKDSATSIREGLKDPLLYIMESKKDINRMGQIKKLEHAAEEYENSLDYYECINQWPSVGFKAGAQWQREQMRAQAEAELEKTDITLADMVAFEEGMKLGRRLEREQMMKDAVTAVVNEGDKDFLTITLPAESYAKLGRKYKGGEKLELIIKEDEK